MLVTGGSQGLGFSIARAFGKQGAKVILWARDSERLRTAVERLHEDQIEASYETVDVLDAAAVNEGMQTIEKHREVLGLDDGLILDFHHHGTQGDSV